MATNIQLVTYAGQTVTPLDDAMLYESAITSGIIYGCECSLSGGNTLHMVGGHGIICGRKFTVFESDTPIPLSPGGTLNGRMKVHLDLADTGEPIKFVIETAAQLPELTQESNVNANNGIYEFNMCTFKVSETAVSDFWQAFPKAMAACNNVPINCGSISRLPVTIKDARITKDMKFSGYAEMSNEAAMTSKWNVNTVDGAVTISGSISGTTTLLINLTPVKE
jgi:hypothetical protein